MPHVGNLNVVGVYVKREERRLILFDFRLGGILREGK
jgi:hypothetical protein